MGSIETTHKRRDPNFELFLRMMAARRGLTAAFSTLSLSSTYCIRNTPSKVLQVSRFSTSPINLGGPITRLRRERRQAKLKRAKARAEELRIQREARADPVIGHPTEFTQSLLRSQDVLARTGSAANSRSGEENWPLLTNFGIGSEDSLTLAVGASAAEKGRLKMRAERLKNPKQWKRTEQAFHNDAEEAFAHWMDLQEKKDIQKREAMARLIDMTNANNKAITSANIEKAIIYFGRHEGDTGSPEVQAGVLTVRILALHEHMQHNRQDKRTKRALNMLVHQRQKMLRYLRRKYPPRYAECIKEIGLDDSAVTREVR